MNKNTKGILVAVSTLGLIGVAYYFLIYKKSSKAKAEKNFKDLLNNLGVKTSGESYTTEFNEGKNIVTFFNNNRFVTKVKGADLASKKGTYTDGGKKLFVDGGNVIESGSVWGNLLKTL